MAKKKLSIKTKLGQSPPSGDTAEKLNLVKKTKTYPRSYRWREYDLELIEDLILKTRDLSGYKVDATKLIRGALQIASKKSPEKLLEAIKNAELNSLTSRIK